MSITRRIAKSALLTAAGAASVVGAAAGSANAAELPQIAPVGGLSNLDNLDGENLGDNVDKAAQNVSALAADVGSEAVKDVVPTAGQAAGELTREAAPAVNGLPTNGLSTDGLPTDGLPTDGLPTDQLTGSLPVGNGSLGGAGLPV